MKISASVYSWKKKTVEEAARALDAAQVDYFHIDCNDNLEVFDDIASIRQVSSTPIDLHIITDKPEKYYDEIQEHKVEMVCFQQENLNGRLEIPDYVTAKLGLSICTGTNTDTFRSLKDKLSFVMFMTTNPGQSGGAFNQQTFQEIRKFRREFPNKSVHVDGGINSEIGFILKNMGVSCAITGSYLANAEIPGAALLNMRSGLPDLGYKLSEFMLNWNELPVVKESEATLFNLISAINSKKLGFGAVVDEHRKLKGIVTDGDVRRGMLKNIDELEKLTPNDIINRNFIPLFGNATVKDMMTVVKANNAPILFFPIIDNEQRLIGAISFNNFIKGEL